MTQHQPPPPPPPPPPLASFIAARLAPPDPSRDPLIHAGFTSNGGPPSSLNSISSTSTLSAESKASPPPGSQPLPPPPPPPPPPPSLRTVGFTGPPRLPPPPPPPPLNHTVSTNAAPTLPPSSVGRTGPPRPPPPPPSSGTLRTVSVPPPPVPKNHVVPPPPPRQGLAPAPAATSVGRGKTSSIASLGRGSASLEIANSPKKNSLKPRHRVKGTGAMKGSLRDSQKQATNNSDAVGNKGGGPLGPSISKPKKVQLVDSSKALNCEIMLCRVGLPLHDIINAVLAFDSAALDIYHVEKLIKSCPTKEETEKLKSYTGDKQMLGIYEQFFMELMKVPRIESKLRVFAFKITFSSQVKDLKCNLNTINAAAREVKESVKLRQIMQTVHALRNAFNQGIEIGSAVGFTLDSLLKLSDSRARNKKMTLMHCLCKVLSDKKPELVNFDQDLVHLEAASKIQLKDLAKEMQAVRKGLEKVEQELSASENCVVSTEFQKVMENFHGTAEADVNSLSPLYSEAGVNADSLCRYFGEDPVRCPFERVTQILVKFMRRFIECREENAKQAEAEKKKLEKEAMKERAATHASSKKDGEQRTRR